MKKILSFILAVVCVAGCFTACTESSSTDINGSSVSESSSSDASSESSSADSSDTQTTTTTTSETTTSETTTTTTTASEPQTTTTTSSADTKAPAPVPVPVNTDLKTVATTLFKAQTLSYTESPGKAFDKATEKGPGVYSLFADIKTKEMFDPFDDLYLSSSQKALEAAKADAQVFFYGTDVRVEYTDSDGNKKEEESTDGYIFAINFKCKDEAEAKKVYSIVFTEEMKNHALNDADKPAFDFGTDHAIATSYDDGLKVTMSYYRLGNNVLAAGMYEVTDFKKYKPVNYKKMINYTADLDKLCSAFGAAKLPSSVK